MEEDAIGIVYDGLEDYPVYTIEEANSLSASGFKVELF